MSLILEALNRSQRERDNRDTVPGIQTQHTQEAAPLAVGWQRILPWLALIGALCVIVWLIFGGESRIAAPADVAPTVVQPVVVAPMGDNPVQEAPAQNVPKKAQQATVPRAQPEKPTVQPKPAVANSAVSDLYKKGVDQEAAVAVQAEAALPAAKLIESTSDQGASAKPARAEQEIDIEKMVALARAEAENVALAEHAAPFLSELSQRTKDQIPTIYYNQHDYSDQASQSSVTLNGEMLRPGGGLAGGLKLDEILPDSVVLSHRGTQFRLKALNSWINL